MNHLVVEKILVKLFNIRCTKSQNLNDSRLNEDVIGAAPTGDDPTKSE